MTSTVAYEFDDTVCTEICSLMCFDTEFARRTDGLIEPTYFPNTVESIYARIAIDHFNRYSEAPSPSAWGELVKNAFKTGLFRGDQKVDAVHKLGEIHKLEVRSRGWLMDCVAEFAKQQALTNAMFSVAKELGKTTDPTRFERVELLMRESLEVSLKTEDEDYDYFERIEERTEERLLVAAGGRPKTGVTTGVSELDAVLKHGGWGKKEMSILMGGAKASKSFHLSMFGGFAVLAGKNVLLLTGENSVEITSTRIDAFMSQVRISEEYVSPHTMKIGVENQAAKSTTGILKIRWMDADVFSPKDLQRMLDDYKTKGLTFDLVVIDYMDLMAPDHRTNEPRENSRLTWVGARRIAARENIALLSATQTNREGHKSATVKAEHAAEDFNKIRTADLVLGISRTDDEKAQSKARITFAASRNQPDGATLFVTQDLDMGMAISNVDSVE